MSVIRCGGCRRAFAFADASNALRKSVYCSSWCMVEHPVDKREVRNDEWRILYAHGRNPLSIAKLYGISHSLVYRTLKRDKTA